MSDSIQLAADFVAALYYASRRNPAAWRQARSLSEAMGVTDPKVLAQAARDAEKAGLIDRRINTDWVRLTNRGLKIAVGEPPD